MTNLTLNLFIVQIFTCFLIRSAAYTFFYICHNDWLMNVKEGFIYFIATNILFYQLAFHVIGYSINSTIIITLVFILSDIATTYLLKRFNKDYGK